MAAFEFRDILPGLYIGTASDRYAGWLGQIYTPALYEKKITSRKRRLGGKVFEEKVLPVECVREYFCHFSVLEIDFTFYGLLTDRSGAATNTLQVLRAYAAHLERGDKVILKAPQAISARRLFRKGDFAPNADYLDSRIFTNHFYEPALSVLGSSLGGIIFEQEYQKAKEREKPESLADGLRKFFGSIPRDSRYHLELRTEAYLSPPVFQVLREFGIGQVMSHWTWLPALRKQYRLSEGGLLNRGGNCLIRLLTPRHMRYEEAYARAFPFDALVEEMISDGMIEDTVFVMQDVLQKGGQVTVIANNRAGGNAPLLAALIVNQFAKLRGGG